MKVLEPSLTDEELARVEKDTFRYFADEVNLENGLIPDSTRQDAPSSIAAVGFALTAYPIAVERKYLSRADAIKRTLTTLRFFHDAPQGKEKDATGYKGFYYHFLDMKTGRRAGKCEISTIDSTYLLAGALTASCYFNGETKNEREFRGWLKRFTTAPTGTGRRTALSRFRMVGGRSEDSSSIAGPDTVKR